MSEKRVAPPDGGSGDLVLIQRHLENLSAGEILEELDARMEEMTDQSCDPELIRLYLDMEAGRVNPKLSTVIHIASESNISLDVLKSEVRGTHAVSLPPE